MCFSADASLGVAVALLPAGAYCVDAAWRKKRSYLLLAVVPLVFGIQQLCEGLFWLGIERRDQQITRAAAVAYLGFALAVWPVWIPLALAAIDSCRRIRLGLTALAGIGLLFGYAWFIPLAVAAGQGINPTIVGHSIRYDLSFVPAVQSFWWGAWFSSYLIAVTVPFMISRNHQLRPLGVSVILAAIVSYASFEYAFASIWCFFAAI